MAKRYQRGNQTTQWPKDTKGVIRQHNGQMKKDQQRSRKHTYKTKDRVTWTPRRVSSSCSTSGARRVTLSINPVISHECNCKMKNWRKAKIKLNIYFDINNAKHKIFISRPIYHVPSRKMETSVLYNAHISNGHYYNTDNADADIIKIISICNRYL